MRELRAILLGVPPLLADIIRRSVAERLAAAGVRLSIVGPANVKAAPDVVIIRASARLPVHEIRSKAAAVLTISADLSEISGPGADDVEPFTLEGFAARLLALATEMPER